MPELKSVAVIGCGLIGGSLLRALCERAPALRLLAFDSRPDTRALVRESLGIETSAAPDDSLRQVDLVVLAVPVDVLLTILPSVASLLDGSDAVLTDVGGIKQPINALAASLGRDVAFVGGHPMAGRERGGFGSADAMLFRNRAVAISPLDDTPEHAVALVEALWRLVRARTLRCTAREHDRAVAHVSHVPHLIAASLALVAGRGGELSRELAAGGFRDTTRMAEDPTVRHAATRNEFVPAIARAVADELRRLAEKIEQGQDPGALLDEAATARKTIVRD